MTSIAKEAGFDVEKLVVGDWSKHPAANELTQRKFVGEWNYEGAQRDGSRLDKSHFGNSYVEITDKTLTLHGELTFVMSYELDTSAQPAAIKLKIVKAPFGEGSSASGIVQLKDGVLALCYNQSGGPAPTKFEAAAESGHSLFLLRRKKIEPKRLSRADLIGVWDYQHGERNGLKLAKDHFTGRHVEITEETLTLEGDQRFVMVYELDTSSAPAVIRFSITESEFGAGARAPGIVQLRDGKLYLCYSPRGGGAPTKFEAGEGSGHSLFVLSRRGD